MPPPYWIAPNRAEAAPALLVPSMPARLERNILINTGHHDAKGITHGLAEPVWWGDRLYG